MSYSQIMGLSMNGSRGSGTGGVPWGVSMELSEKLKTSLAGKYEVGEMVGQGGMATVYRARDVRHNRDVAIKFLKPEVAGAMGDERFLAEISVASRLSHPRILPLFDSGKAEGTLFYVMPFVEGPTLSDLLKREGQLSIEETMRIAEGVGAALSSAHGQGVIHRDVKPDNIMLQDGEPLVTDFGIALAVKEAGGERLTETGMAIGTPEYMSPEQAVGDQNVDERTDVYALASIVYEMLAGEPPFTGPNTQAVLARRLTETPRPLRPIRDQVPLGMEQALLKGLARATADRHRTVDAFLGDLRIGLKTDTVPVAESPRSGKQLVLAIAALVVVALGVWGWSMLGEGDASTPEIDPNLVAVMPFTVSGGPEESEFIGEAMMGLLSSGLHGAGDLTTVDTRALQSRASDLDPASGDRDARLAASFGAGRMVVGSVTDLGGTLRVEARLQQIGDDAPVVTSAVEGASSELTRLAERVSVDLIRGLSGQAEVNPAQVRMRMGGSPDESASPLSDSLEALKAFLQGEREVREGRYNSSIPLYQRATQIDSDFALAWHRLSTSAWAARRHDIAGPAADNANRLVDRLSPRHASHVRAFDAYRNGRAREAELLYGDLIRRHPSDVEAWYMSGEVLYHLGPLSGRPTSTATRAFEETLLLEPTHRSAMGHLAEMAVDANDLVRTDTLTAKYLRVHPDADLAIWMKMLRAIHLGDDGARNAIRSELDEGTAVPMDMMYAAAFYEDLDWAVELATEAADPSRSIVERLGALAYRSFLNAARGQMNDALADLAIIDGAVPGLPLRMLVEGNLALLPLFPLDTAQLVRLMDAYAELPVSSPAENRQRMYLRGAMAAELGMADRANAMADSLAAMDLDDSANRHGEQARDIRARVALHSGDPEEAWRQLEQNVYEIEEVMDFQDATASMVHSRALTAAVLMRLNRDEDALGWLAGLSDGVLPVNPVFESAFLGFSFVRRAQIYDRSGDSENAVKFYSRFIDLWEQADESVSNHVDDARSRLEVLGSR